MFLILSQSSQISSFLLQALVFSLLFTSVKPTTFSYPSFESIPKNLRLQGDATSASGFIELTTNRRDAMLNNSIGRAIYAEPIHLWDSATGIVADFTTHFQFVINMLFPPKGADGLAFFLAPSDSVIPPISSGDRLGLYSLNSMFNSSDNPVVAVEFDTFQNGWDPRGDHVGIDVNSIRSVVTWNASNLKNGSTANVWVSYNSTTQNLSVYLTFARNPDFNGNSILSYVLDLKSILPEWISVGFSGATGADSEAHNILSWEFNSTEFPSSPGSSGSSIGKKKTNTIAVIGSTVAGSVLVIGLGMILILFLWWNRKKGKKHEDDNDLHLVEDYEKGAGPKRFPYNDLVVATNNFAEEGKLGEGGFGGVYRGVLTDPTMNVAVKRVSRESPQGKKEFISEVKIISQLRHCNLVQLIGWCNERGEFLLVYELMPNGSLDYHLFGQRTMLTWVSRYKIALGLASALLYLHEEWEHVQCVVHRDIKSSNVMLDSNFNAKLGDFGLARFVEHGLGVKTTMLAGTMGYLAPECLLTGKSGKESDVYSFGVVALEIACGRRVVEPNEEEGKVGLVAWVWELYGSERLLEAVDNTLGGNYDEKQILRLLVVGLWCANPDYSLRPSIKQAIGVLNSEAPLPELPFQISVPAHLMALHTLGLSNASSGASTNSYNTDSSHKSKSSSVTLLQMATR